MDRPRTARSLASEAAFWEMVATQGGQRIESSLYLNSTTPVVLCCRNGHGCRVTPNKLQQGQGICRTCAGNDPDVAETKFWEQITTGGAQRTKNSVYINTRTPVVLICRVGHLCHPRPSELVKGGAICSTCTQRDSAAAEAIFRQRVTALGGQLADDSVYVNNHTPVKMLCSMGHECQPTPNHVQQGKGICRTCARNDPVASEAEFWRSVTKQSGRRIKESVYVNALTPVQLRCGRGHLCSQTPANVQQGRDICSQCIVSYDRVYLLAHRNHRAIKVGIASNEGRVRGHISRDYLLVEQWCGLGHDQARATERAVLAAWRQACWPATMDAPLDGRTETADFAHLEATRDHLRSLLGEPD